MIEKANSESLPFGLRRAITAIFQMRFTVAVSSSRMKNSPLM